EPGPARRDLLDLETLPTPELVRLLEGASAFRKVLATPSRKKAVLPGTAVANVFFEASTRTRVSFEWAAKRVGADRVCSSRRARRCRRARACWIPCGRSSRWASAW